MNVKSLQVSERVALHRIEKKKQRIRLHLGIGLHGLFKSSCLHSLPHHSDLVNVAFRMFLAVICSDAVWSSQPRKSVPRSILSFFKGQAQYHDRRLSHFKNSSLCTSDHPQTHSPHHQVVQNTLSKFSSVSSHWVELHKHAGL